MHRPSHPGRPSRPRRGLQRSARRTLGHALPSRGTSHGGGSFNGPVFVRALHIVAFPLYPGWAHNTSTPFETNQSNTSECTVATPFDIAICPGDSGTYGTSR